jgi:hypothetical protein
MIGDITNVLLSVVAGGLGAVAAGALVEIVRALSDHDRAQAVRDRTLRENIKQILS